MRALPLATHGVFYSGKSITFLGLLNIEDRWKELGLSLGYTRSEVNRKFTDADNPIGAIQCDFIARGGETRVFTEAMYKVSRMYKLIPYDQMMENRENKQIENLSDSKLFLIEIISLHQLFIADNNDFRHKICHKISSGN